MRSGCLLVALWVLVAGQAQATTRRVPAGVSTEIHLEQGQSLSYCGENESISFGPGDSLVLDCRDDSLVVNGRAVSVQSFPNDRICDFGLLKRVYGGGPRVRTLLAGPDHSSDEESRWHAAVRVYAREVVGEQAHADSLFLTWNLGVKPPRPPSGNIIDLFAELQWQAHPDAEYPQIFWLDLVGVPIPITFCREGGRREAEAIVLCEMSCSTAQGLSVYLADLARSKVPFHVELGSALVFFPEEP